MCPLEQTKLLGVKIHLLRESAVSEWQSIVTSADESWYLKQQHVIFNGKKPCLINGFHFGRWVGHMLLLGTALNKHGHPAGPNIRLMDSSSLSPPHLTTSSLGLINPDSWLFALRSLPNLDSIRFHSWPHFACTHFHKWHWRRNMTGVYPQLPSYFLIPAPADATISWIIMLCWLGISLYSHQSAMAFDFPKQTTITP